MNWILLCQHHIIWLSRSNCLVSSYYLLSWFIFLCNKWRKIFLESWKLLPGHFCLSVPCWKKVHPLLQLWAFYYTFSHKVSSSLRMIPAILYFPLSFNGKFHLIHFTSCSIPLIGFQHLVHNFDTTEFTKVVSNDSSYLLLYNNYPKLSPTYWL